MLGITLEAASRLLRHDPYRYLAELMGLDLNIPRVHRRAFGDAPEPRVVMIVDEMPHGTWATFSGPTHSAEARRR